MSIPKRFIAGAICPRCAAMDKLRTWEANGIRYRNCVACDFFEQLPIEEQDAPELATRVNQARDDERRNSVQPVRILDPKGGSKG